MKCTNNKRILLTAFCLTAVLCAGCGQKEYRFAYNPDTTVSGFQVTANETAPTAAGFAADLCVVTDDVPIAGVDTSQAGAAGLFDVNRHEALYARNVHEKLYPASLTKVMTALVALKNGNVDDVITVTENVRIDESGAQLCGLKAGDKLTLDQALHALLMNSANDAGIAIAEHIGGSVEGFARMMNEEAQRIGATNSHFVNPHGLQDDSHYVTAYDMYLIFNEAIKQERFNEIIRTVSYDTTYADKDGREKELKCSSTNQYLQGAVEMPANVTVNGGKTGTTNAAGNCLVLLSKDTSGAPYISVILRCPERQVLYEEMSDLLLQIGK